MPTIPGVDLTKIKTRCQKKRCKTRDFVLHRHHRGHEHMFVTQFLWRFGEPRYMEFALRYHRYEREDVVEICSKHHREIHEIYDKIIAEYCRKRRKALRDFSWAEARELMSLLRARCDKWLGQQTKGSNTPWPSNGKTKRKAVDFVRLILESNEEEFTEAVTYSKDEVPF